MLALLQQRKLKCRVLPLTVMFFCCPGGCLSCLNLSKFWLASQTTLVVICRSHLPSFALALRNCGSLRLRLLPEAALLQWGLPEIAFFVILALRWTWQGSHKKSLAQQTSRPCWTPGWCW